jgi:hypothetical protein
VSCAQDGGVIVIEVIVEPIVVPLPTTLVPDEVANIQVAVRVAIMCRMPSVPLSLEYSQDCIVFDIVNTLAYYTK